MDPTVLGSVVASPLTGNHWVDITIATSLFLVALVTIFKTVVKVGHGIGVLDEIKDDLIGTAHSRPLSVKVDDLASKVDDLAGRPAMNGGFDRLAATVERLESSQTLERAEAAKAAKLAADAAAAASRADHRAKEAADRLVEMHRENRVRLTGIEVRLDEHEQRQRTYLASLLEGYSIDLEHPPPFPVPPHTHDVSGPNETP
jgi:hypothetical protein